MSLEKRAPMINGRYKHCMTLMGGQLLMVTGGWKQVSKRAMKECETYNIAQNTWTSVSPMNEAR